MSSITLEQVRAELLKQKVEYLGALGHHLPDELTVELIVLVGQLLGLLAIRAWNDGSWKQTVDSPPDSEPLPEKRIIYKGPRRSQ